MTLEDIFFCLACSQ